MNSSTLFAKDSVVVFYEACQKLHPSAQAYFCDLYEDATWETLNHFFVTFYYKKSYIPYQKMENPPEGWDFSLKEDTQKTVQENKK
jgi:hypothetical protein